MYNLNRLILHYWLNLSTVYNCVIGLHQ